MNKSDFDREFDSRRKEFDQNFKDIKKTVKTGAAVAIAGSLIVLVIYACIAIAAIWAVGHFIFHAW